MNKLFDSGVLHIMPAENGFVFVAFQGEYANRAIVMYRHCNPITGEITPITRSVYLLNKFGKSFEKYEKDPSDFLNLRTINLPEHKMMILHPSGDASIVNSDGEPEWKNKMIYGGHGPSDAAYTKSGVWVCYPMGNTIMRYNLRNMRQDLKVGSDNSTVLKSPEALYNSEDSQLLVCTGENKKILKVDLTNYVIDEYAAFDEPVRQYIRCQYNEIVRLDSGIYML